MKHETDFRPAFTSPAHFMQSVAINISKAEMFNINEPHCCAVQFAMQTLRGTTDTVMWGHYSFTGELEQATTIPAIKWIAVYGAVLFDNRWDAVKWFLVMAELLEQFGTWEGIREAKANGRIGAERLAALPVDALV